MTLSCSDILSAHRALRCCNVFECDVEYRYLDLVKNDQKQPSNLEIAALGMLLPTYTLRLADIETLHQALLDPENVPDHLIGQHSALQVAHDLMDLDDHCSVEAG